MQRESKKGSLYIVASPIGNLGDITYRGIEVFQTVDKILAEDTRHSAKLLNHYQIKKKIVSYHDHSSPKKIAQIIEWLNQGENLACITDAGTPTISDPGFRLISECQKQDIPVLPIPGPSAAIAALSVSGLPSHIFHFWGFMPVKPGKRKKLFDELNTLTGTHIFYISPHKIKKTLVEMEMYFADYEFFIAKEMTKKFERFLKGSIQDINLSMETEPHWDRGEFCVLLSRREGLQKGF